MNISFNNLQLFSYPLITSLWPTVKYEIKKFNELNYLLVFNLNSLMYLQYFKKILVAMMMTDVEKDDDSDFNIVF